MYKRKIKIIITFFLISSLVTLQISAQTKIRDNNGLWNGFYNMNPDPSGEPWIVRELPPLSENQNEGWKNTPTFKLSPQIMNRKLPKTVDNSKAPQFRKIFGSVGGCSGQISAMGYHFTYERNLCLGKEAISGDNICAFGFTWNFLNKGKNIGTWPKDGYTIAMAMGCAHKRDFNGSEDGGSSTIWLDNYEGYKNADDCHITEKVPFKTTEIIKLKNWFYDKGTGSGKNGGLVTFGSSVDFTVETIASGPFKGQKVATTLKNGSAHAMTLAGYSDEVSFDVNGDGKITNDIDITRDGIVDYRDRETGAWLLVNNWGTAWNNKGKVWVLYSGFGAQQIWGIKVAKNNTKLMVKAKITSSNRGSIVIKTGYSTDVNASSPTKTKGYGGAFDESGGSFPMGGKDETSTITIGLSCSKFHKEIIKGGGKGKIFLQISGTGTVNELSVIEYPGGKEFKSTQSNMEISGTMNLGVEVELTNTHVNNTNIAQINKTLIKKVGNEYSLSVTKRGIYNVYIINMLGKKVYSFKTGLNQKEYLISKNLVNGVYFVNINSPKLNSTKKLKVFR